MMPARTASDGLPEGKTWAASSALEASYVSVSRSKKRLAILAKMVDSDALATVGRLFGKRLLSSWVRLRV